MIIHKSITFDRLDDAMRRGYNRAPCPQQRRNEVIIYQVTQDPSYSGSWSFNFLSYKDAVDFANDDTYPEHIHVVEFEFDLTDGELVYTSTTEE